MKHTHYIYISAALAMLTACSDDVDPVYTVGEEDNAIQLRAGIVEGGAALTRASFTDTEAMHATHVSLTQNTKIVWKADGKWKHGTGTEAPRSVSQTSLATIGAASGNHNSVSAYDPVLFWDDYGTADPDNTAGRSAGLSIYAAAVDGKTSLPDELTALKTTPANWTALSWSVYDKTPSNGKMLDRDLIVANNLKGSNAFTFEDFKKIKNNASDKNVNAGLLEFRHMMSKVTINLKAGAGFPTASGASIAHFEATPVVQLGQGVLDQQTAYAYTLCSVNVETGAVAATTTDASKKIIVAEHDATATTNWSDTYHCLVVPGTSFKGTTDDVIAKIKADDNVYYVDGKAIRKAIYKYYHSTATEDEVEAGYKSADLDLSSVKNYETQPGINYILKVIVNKTGIEVTATLVNWSYIEAGEVSPKINIDANFGSTSATGSINSFCLYRSASDVKSTPMVKNDMSGYSKGLATSTTNNYFPYETVVNKSGDPATWSMATQLYWPTHNTHYHFRGVAPETSTDAIAAETKPTAPHVEALSGEDATQIIKVWDAPYGSTLFPSNLMIGMPILESSVTCNNPDHTSVNLKDYGICATEGKINLEFAYMMSQVEVLLKTDEGTSKAVRLEGAQVEIINGYTEGYVKLGNREAVATGSNGVANQKAAFILPAISTDGLTGEALVTAQNTRRGAIVPQKLYDTETYSATTPNNSSDTHNLRFKVTITNNDAVLYADADEYNTAKGYTSGDPGYCTDFSSLTEEQKTKYPASQDIYYADIAPIKKQNSSEWVVPENNGKWESGQHYVYILTLRKTEISVEATLVDWNTVYAVEDVWF